MATDQVLDPPTDPRPWWEQPAPAGWTGPWPPPLGPGDTYGPEVGQVNHGVTAGTPSGGSLGAGISPPPSGGSGNSGGFTDFTTPYTAPANLNLGGMTGLEYIPPVPKFDAPAFQKPSLQDAEQEPGYEFARGQGIQALENSAAARGLSNSGGTAKDLIAWGNSFANQNYNNVYDRSERAYNMAYRGAQDEFSPLMHQYDTLSAAGQHQNDLNYQHAWDQWIQDYNIFRNNQNDRFDRLYRTSTA